MRWLVPVPTIQEQGQIIAKLDALRMEVDAITQLQNETADELAALFPSILDKALRGELS